MTRVKAKDKSEFQIGIGGASALAAPMFVKDVMFETKVTYGAEGHLWCAVSCMESHVIYASNAMYAGGVIDAPPRARRDSGLPRFARAPE